MLRGTLMVGKILTFVHDATDGKKEKKKKTVEIINCVDNQIA